MWISTCPGIRPIVQVRFVGENARCATTGIPVTQAGPQVIYQYSDILTNVSDPQLAPDQPGHRQPAAQEQKAGRLWRGACAVADVRIVGDAAGSSASVAVGDHKGVDARHEVRQVAGGEADVAELRQL